MIIGILTFKGGQAKTTTAVHLAATFATDASTALIDCDPNESALTWARLGNLPFETVPEPETARVSRVHHHLVIDTNARPEEKHIRSIQKNCDLIVLPVTPDPLALNVLTKTLTALASVEKEKLRVLLTICPPYPSRDAENARRLIVNSNLPIFTGQIRRAVAFQRAWQAGMTVDKVNDPRAQDCAADYAKVAREILKAVK
ncbi:MAG: ParA family protein [Acidobacteria bacterium]|nr:ParA family protein [Acidobacteriota bacterium]